MEKVTKTEIFLLCLTALFLGFTLWLFLGNRDGGSIGSSYSVTAERGQEAGQEPQPQGALNINRATEEQLQSLDGIGPVLARRIVDYRTAHGPFDRPEELLEVEGIGPVLLEQIRAYITTEEEP